MKRGLQLVLMLCVFLLGTQVSFAGGLLGGTGVSDVRVYDSEGLMKIQTLAIADSIYNGPTKIGRAHV